VKVISNLSTFVEWAQLASQIGVRQPNVVVSLMRRQGRQCVRSVALSQMKAEK